MQSKDVNDSTTTQKLTKEKQGNNVKNTETPVPGQPNLGRKVKSRMIENDIEDALVDEMHLDEELPQLHL